MMCLFDLILLSLSAMALGEFFLMEVKILALGRDRQRCVFVEQRQDGSNSIRFSFSRPGGHPGSGEDN